MRRRDKLFLALLALGVLILSLAQGRLQAAGHGTLKVRATYTGKGQVDQQHRIYVLVLDANPFTVSSLVDATSQRIPPAPEAGVSHVLAVQGTADRSGVLTFPDLPASTVYALVLFDKNGEYNGRVGSFSEGEPMGVYGTPPDKLEAIKVEGKKAVQISVVFDDSRVTP